MTVRSFLHYVELRTKVASVLPFIVGTLYAQWGYGAFDGINWLLMLIALLCIDMATTASNHYTDYLKAIHRAGYNYERHNTLVRDGLNLRTAFITIVILVLVGAASGLILVARTDFVVLGLGAFSFGVGLLYSWGPIPISRTPFGEAVSGFMMGFVILFLSVYIHLEAPGWIGLQMNGWLLRADMNLYELVRLLMVSLPLVCGIANIMLSNNLSDLEEDKINGRLTLPILVGSVNGLRLSALLYVGIYAGILISLTAGWLPMSSAAVFLTAPVVIKSYKRFAEHVSKEETFVLSVKCFLLTASVYALSLAAGVMAAL